MVRVIVDPPLMSSDDQQREVACQQGHVLAPDPDEVFSAVFELGLKGSKVVQGCGSEMCNVRVTPVR